MGTASWGVDALGSHPSLHGVVGRPSKIASRSKATVLWKGNMPWLEISSLVNLQGADEMAQWNENMPWWEISALVVAGIAAVMAAGSLLISRRAKNISELQALPRVSVVREWLGRLRGGERNLYFNVERISDRPDWVVVSVRIRRTWRNVRKRCFLARGEVVGYSRGTDGRSLPNGSRTGNWESCIVYEPPVREAVVFLHPEAPDCEVTLEVILNTAPSPTIKRRIKSLKESPAMRLPSSVTE